MLALKWFGAARDLKALPMQFPMSAISTVALLVQLELTVFRIMIYDAILATYQATPAGGKRS